MPATSPRFTITISEEANTALKRLASAQGRPVAALIRELLHDAAPTIGQLATSIEALKAAEASARAGIAGSLSEVADELQPHLQGILGHLQAIGDLGEPDEVPQGGAGVGRLRLAATAPTRRKRQPPTSSTGVVNG